MKSHFQNNESGFFYISHLINIDNKLLKKSVFLGFMSFYYNKTAAFRFFLGISKKLL